MKNNKINLNNKQFKALHNSENGEVSDATVFNYHRKNDIVWATYESAILNLER